MRVHPNKLVDLFDKVTDWEKFIPFKNDDGSWSFRSDHGTWLSGREDRGNIFF